jgi:hypothetical protein
VGRILRILPDIPGAKPGYKKIKNEKISLFIENITKKNLKVKGIENRGDLVAP